MVKYNTSRRLRIAGTPLWSCSQSRWAQTMIHALSVTVRWSLSVIIQRSAGHRPLVMVWFKCVYTTLSWSPSAGPCLWLYNAQLVTVRWSWSDSSVFIQRFVCHRPLALVWFKGVYTTLSWSPSAGHGLIQVCLYNAKLVTVRWSWSDSSVFIQR